jgi:2-dehydro-3-deoxyphosphogluconate aldolase/(4S)-4-hydroxy-2-oxoglutarate aldolase
MPAEHAAPASSIEPSPNPGQEQPGQPAAVAIFDLLAERRVVPVVVLQDPGGAKPLAAALAAGGLPLAEVTFRTAAAAATVAAMAEDPALTVGAGTVISVDQVDAAVAAGAQFVVSPGFSARVVSRCQELGVPVVPGVATATELMAALDAGITTVKLFPAEASGGIKLLRSLAPVFPQVRFVPTGGITAANAPIYLAEPSVLAVGGSWMVAPSLLAQCSWARVTRLAAEAVALARPAAPEA